MDRIENFGDERTLSFCAFCGGNTGTRDHCPSRVFLDDPLPENLPWVGACRECNEQVSIDEEYLACLISCVISGSTAPELQGREKIRKSLLHTPALGVRIEQASSKQGETLLFAPEHDRVTRVLKKLARGHALFELHELLHEEPADVAYFPLHLLSPQQREEFEFPEASSVWPEVGSRAMQRLVSGMDISESGWIVVQEGRYRYSTQICSAIDVRIVIQEYLGCRIIWGT